MCQVLTLNEFNSGFTLRLLFPVPRSLAFCYTAYFDQSLRGFLPQPADLLCQSLQFQWPRFSLFRVTVRLFRASCRFLSEDEVGLAWPRSDSKSGLALALYWFGLSTAEPEVLPAMLLDDGVKLSTSQSPSISVISW